MNRRRFLASALLATAGTAVERAHAAAGAPIRYKLIAHRGGIVDNNHIEDSLASVQAGIDYGYWMLEIDVRRTKDGVPIIHHDADFRRFYHRTHEGPRHH